MRLASYNVENLFNRAKAMDGATWAEGRPILDAYGKLLGLLGEPVYTDAIKAQMVALLVALGLEKADDNAYVILRQNRGDLVKRPSATGLTIVANGRADWVGSLELAVVPVDEEAMRNTARVMIELEPDVLAVIEAESRPALAAFNKDIVGSLGGPTFGHVMLIDGNDTRGIDVGLMTKPAYGIESMKSHVDDATPDGDPVFSRDCPEFLLKTPSGKRVVLLVNHLKSKGYGTQANSNAKRALQAARVKVIYDGLRAAGEKHVAVVGDFNDTPDSPALAPLLANTDLQDAFLHPSFDTGGYPGTFGACTASNKIDYLLLSPELFKKVVKGGVFRKGLWPGVRPKKWPVFDQLETEVQAGSDHAAVWVDLKL